MSTQKTGAGRQAPGRRGGGRLVRRLALAVGVLVVFVIAVVIGIVVFDRVFQERAVAVVATPSPLPSPSAMAVSDVMNTINGDCTACHLSPDGGVGTKPIPPVGHPTKGWENCTNCHASDRLVATAPGHSGIHADQCLVCHKSETAAAAMRPHSDRNVACLSCHGTTAPLPDSMKGRAESTCWLCHQETTETPPLIPHPLAGNAACLQCHVAGRIGALPSNHQGRTEAICTQCPAPSGNNAPTALHSLVGLEGKCAQCHASGTSANQAPSPGAPGPSGAPAVSPAPPGTQWPLITPSPSTFASPAAAVTPAP
jgi:hypothetical protein